MNATLKVYGYHGTNTYIASMIIDRDFNIAVPILVRYKGYRFEAGGRRQEAGGRRQE